MWDNNIPKDDVDSVLVPFGYEVTFYDEQDFTGTSETIVGLPYDSS